MDADQVVANVAGLGVSEFRALDFGGEQLERPSRVPGRDAAME